MQMSHTQVNSHTTNDLHTWIINRNHKQVKDIEKEDQKLMIHFQTPWELYQNICSKPTTHSYKPIMKPKATSTPLIPTSVSLLRISPPLCDTLSGSCPFIQEKGVSQETSNHRKAN